MRLRRLMFVLMSALASVSFAQQVSEEQAYETALQFLAGGQSAQKAPARNSEQPLTLTYKAQTKKENDLYVFNRDGGGFVIVSADARTVKPVLGYSDSGSFDASNMPPQLQDILSQYQQEINYARENLAPQEVLLQEGSQERKVIVEPLIKTKWNQEEPYNGLCPMDGDRRTAAGCVACAMAQVMNYWRWPERGYGSHRDAKADSLFVDFSQSVYDWDNMAITYTADTPQVKIDAVQKLMYDCGISVDMDYSINGTYTEYIAPSIMYFFNYSQSAQYLKRANYETQWDSIIAAELDAGRPVIYSGVADIGGHAFICDGYDSENYFHFNIGWGGSGDGFYLNTAVKGEGRKGFNDRQDAVIDIYPDYEDLYREGMAICYLDNEGAAILYDIIGSTYLEELVIPDSALIDGVMYPVKSIEKYAYCFGVIRNCKSIITSETLEYIGDYAFAVNPSLSNVYISGSVQEMGIPPFAVCNNLNTIIVNESNPYLYSPHGSNVIIERSSGRLVQGCNYSVIPEQGVTAIGYNAFEGFDSIIEIRLPESVITLELEAFANCSNLKTVYLGSQLRTIERDVFCGCISLTDVYFSSNAAPEIAPPSGMYEPFILPQNCTIHVKPSALESFKAVDLLSSYNIVADVPETTTATSSVRSDESEPKYYDLLGRPVEKDYKGLKIRQRAIGDSPLLHLFEKVY